MAIKQSILAKIDFDNLTDDQRMWLNVHMAERLTVTTAAFQTLVDRLLPIVDDDQKSILEDFVQFLNFVDAASGLEAERIGAMGTPPKIQ